MPHSKSSAPAREAEPDARANQKRRTRQALIDAAVALRNEGRDPGFAEVAERALVSRATAYRYFASVQALSMVMGTEAVLALRDIAGADAGEALAASAWAAQALVKQARAETAEARARRAGR